MIVLGTPPSRHAIDFLDAPGRLIGFLEGRALAAFLRPTGHAIQAAGLAFAALRRITGTGLLDDLTSLFRLLSELLDGFRQRAAEDTASASFAGMNETFLNIRGRDGVIDAVKACWGSLFGARTIYYRGKRGFDQSGMEIAVVVERQIHSSRAGVMFTIDPSTGDTARLVIEGAFGLGESVVSGQVSPDRYVVDKARRAIVVRSVRPKELIIEPTEESGTRTRQLSAEESHRSVLTDDEVLALADLGIRIEEHYGSPQDTEWAIDPEGTIWMLQSRPVTTLSEPAHPSAAATTPGAAPVVRAPGSGPRDGQRRSAPAGLDGRGREAGRRRRARHAHDRAGLGAAHA